MKPSNPMKLYATITSERASKGQGGKWLDIHISNEGKKLLAMITARENENEYNIGIVSLNGERNFKIPKGKKQKGEQRYCEIHPNTLCENRDGWWYCHECGK